MDNGAINNNYFQVRGNLVPTSATASSYSYVEDKIHGEINCDLTNLLRIDGNLSIEDGIISGQISVPDHFNKDYYTGPYQVIPKFIVQVLPTKDKYMYADVQVQAIEVSRTSNPQGGKTVYIGSV